ncbi:MAG: tRNA pseudouridine(38-40) synthase TruA [Candidatus Competibacteraceae bacterium]|jgi:tRNA pseudouridine38-40 synthase|nr:tRNA pseudouridine(38-40) synthase TruA [Candidatus Competibacteraceae bacterium]
MADDSKRTHELTRIALGVEYDGAQFRGWQIQEPGVRTIQESLERALSAVADHTVTTVCAGRTDAGVHSLGQIVHFDTVAQRPSRAWVLGVNTHLPPDVNVLWAQRVPAAFHARFSALTRWYRYVVLNRSVRSALQRTRATRYYQPLDAECMNEAARCLVGKQNFNAFRSRHCQAKSPVRTVYSLTVKRHDEYVILDVEANAFLHHMVRNIAGVLLAIGSGEQPKHWLRTVLAGRDRKLGGVTAPPEGLYLMGVRYADAFQLPRSTIKLKHLSIPHT